MPTIAPAIPRPAPARLTARTVVPSCRPRRRTAGVALAPTAAAAQGNVGGGGGGAYGDGAASGLNIAVLCAGCGLCEHESEPACGGAFLLRGWGGGGSILMGGCTRARRPLRSLDARARARERPDARLRSGAGARRRRAGLGTGRPAERVCAVYRVRASPQKILR